MSDDRNLPLWGGGGGACDDAFGADATTAALKLEYMGCISRPALFPLDPAHWSRGTGLRPLIGMDLPKKVKSMLDMSWISYSVVTTVFFAYCLRFQNLRISFPNWCIFSASPDNFETTPEERKNNIFLDIGNIIPWKRHPHLIQNLARFLWWVDIKSEPIFQILPPEIWRPICSTRN